MHSCKPKSDTKRRQSRSPMTLNTTQITLPDGKTTPRGTGNLLNQRLSPLHVSSSSPRNLTQPPDIIIHSPHNERKEISEEHLAVKSVRRKRTNSRTRRRKRSSDSNRSARVTNDFNLLDDSASLRRLSVSDNESNYSFESDSRPSSPNSILNVETNTDGCIKLIHSYVYNSLPLQSLIEDFDPSCRLDNNLTTDASIVQSIPKLTIESDLLVSYATTKEILEAKGDKESLFDLLTEVNAKLQEMVQSLGASCEQVSIFETTLKKNCSLTKLLQFILKYSDGRIEYENKLEDNIQEQTHVKSTQDLRN
ncbi:unnamed protein product [Mytilus edulis]|uniref:Uncharacterized protein n=1 Tax=Mytilus edulis TaxID=6550 RepID=A0A8S3QEG0_MYTED|nr:unnamed protein product [Mytilus edulis]